MSTIDLSTGTSAQGTKGRAALYGKPVTTFYKIVDLPSVNTLKGSALASADVITVMDIPNNSVLVAPRVVCTEVVDIAQLTLNVGVNGISTTKIVQSGSLSAVGIVATGSSDVTFLNIGSYTTIDATLFSTSGTAPTTGQFVVFASLIDLTAQDGSNINTVS